MQAIDEQRPGDDTDTGRDLYPYEPVDIETLLLSK
jgi:hypothetical protein